MSGLVMRELTEFALRVVAMIRKVAGLALPLTAGAMQEMIGLTLAASWLSYTYSFLFAKTRDPIDIVSNKEGLLKSNIH